MDKLRFYGAPMHYLPNKSRTCKVKTNLTKHEKHSINHRIFFADSLFLVHTTTVCTRKVLDRMTRSEARQEILRHTEIKDHVTFYHSNDKDIYVVYDLASSGNKEKMLQAKPFY